MRSTLTPLVLALVLAVSGLAAAATPQATSTAAAKTTAVATHSVQGRVKSVDTTSLVITRSGKKSRDMSFKLEPSTERDGAIAVGSPVSVRYRMDGQTMVATAVNAQPAKSPRTARK